MASHIGIVAVSPEGSAICYRKIAKRASQIEDAEKRPLVSLHNLPFATYVDAILAGKWEEVGTMLLWSSETLAGAGADFCILPDNVTHFAASYAESVSPLPWLSMTDLVAEAICADHRRTIGIIGTNLVMTGSVYQTVLGMQGVTVLAPEDGDADRIDRIIYEELVEGRVEEASCDAVLGAVDRLAARGCEGVILGSTEIPLLFDRRPPALPMYDPVDLLVDGAMKRAAAME